jgi:hypothetical protein
VTARASWAFGLVALALVGAARAEDVKEDDLKAAGLAYHSYYAQHKRGPAKGGDLAPHLVGFDDAGKRVLGLLKSGDLVFVYDVGLDQMPAGAAKTVLGYQKGTARTGGLVLMGDGRYKKMTPAEFKAATLAARAEDKQVKVVRSWRGILDEKKLTEVAPAKGYLTSQAEWEKVWKAWRKDEKLPEVDFKKHLVLMNLGGKYPVGHEVTAYASPLAQILGGKLISSRGRA